MDPLNQFALGQVLGSTMRPIKRARFGGFGLLEATAEGLCAKISDGDLQNSSDFAYDHDRVEGNARPVSVE